MAAIDVETALRYPTETDEWVKTILIGGVLSIFGFLLIPLFVVYGYVVRVLRARFTNDPEPPVFDDWGTLLTDGLQAWVIGVIYLLIPAIVGTVTVGGSIIAIATGTRGGVAAGLGGLLFGLVLTFVLALVFGYFAVAAIVNFAHEEEFGAAFDFETLKAIAFDGDYAVAWLISVGIFVGVSIVSGVLNFIPFLGAIIGAFLFFYAQVVAAYLWAGGYTAAHGHAEGAEPA